MSTTLQRSRRQKVRAKKQPPLVTKTALLLLFTNLVAALLIPSFGPELWAILCVQTLKYFAAVLSRLSEKTQGLLSDILYLSSFALPLFPSLALVVFLDPSYPGILTISAMFLAGAAVFILFNIAALRFFFSRDFVNLIPQRGALAVAFDVTSLVMSPIGQELIYRGVLLQVFLALGIHPVIAGLASSTLFVLEHRASRWAKANYDFSKYLQQFIISSLCVFSYFQAGIFAAIALHLGFNIVVVVKDLFHFIQKQKGTKNVGPTS